MSDNNLASELVKNRSFKPITIEEIIFMISSKNRKIVPYHGANPNTRNDARLRSPSPIMAPDHDNDVKEVVAS